MNFGKILDEPFTVYTATDCVGSHRLDDLTPYPIRYKLRYLDKKLPERPDTPDFRFGRFVHSLALEGDELTKARYIVIPEGAPKWPTERQLIAKNPSAETKAAIKWWEEFKVLAAGREALSLDDWNLGFAMIEAVRANPSLAGLFKRGKPEVTFRHKMAYFGIQSRIDWLDEEDEAGVHITDLKTISALEQFDEHFRKYNYYRQAAFYRLVVARVLGLQTSQVQFSFAVVEKQEPYLSVRRDPDAESLAKGEEEVIRDLTLLKSCYQNNQWPGPVDSPVSLPLWVTRRAS